MENHIYVCKKCGKCCCQSETAKKITLYPEERQVLIQDAKIRNISLQIVPEMILPDEFNHRLYIARYALILPAKSKCPFLSENRCQIYAHRPLSCRTFPLIVKSGYRSPNDMILDSHCAFIQSLTNNSGSILDLGKIRFYGILLGARERAIFLHIQEMMKHREFQFGKVPTTPDSTWPECDLIPSQ